MIIDELWFWYMVAMHGYDKAIEFWNAYVEEYNRNIDTANEDES